MLEAFIFHSLIYVYFRTNPQIEGTIRIVGYYQAADLILNLGTFIVNAQFEHTTGSDLIVELREFARSAPLSAVVLALSLPSLAGIPAG